MRANQMLHKVKSVNTMTRIAYQELNNSDRVWIFHQTLIFLRQLHKPSHVLKKPSSNGSFVQPDWVSMPKIEERLVHLFQLYPLLIRFAVTKTIVHGN